MNLDFGVVLAATMATVASPCSWAHPGANPYRGDPVNAVDDFAMSVETRRKLKAMMAAHAYTDVAAITRDGIEGASRYDDLREMHNGHGQTCHGAVDRSAWTPARQERGLVYCVEGVDTCVIVPTVCNNVSLVTRRPDPMADEPIDIQPAAGPPAPGANPLFATADPDTFAGGSATPAALPGNGETFSGSGNPTSPSSWSPIVSGGAIGAGVPRHPTSPIPEPSAWCLMLAGLAALRLAVNVERRRQRPQAAKSGFSKRALP